MSLRGNCYDNAAMDSWNSTLKSELGEYFAGLRTRNRSFLPQTHIHPRPQLTEEEISYNEDQRSNHNDDDAESVNQPLRRIGSGPP